MHPTRHRRPSKPCRHEAYFMTCAEYDELADFAEDRCQLCRVSPEELPQGMLFIDHDAGLGQWAVRGLLCNRCNSRIAWADPRDSGEDAYLESPWYRHLLDRAGIDGLDIPEPPLGTWITAGTMTYHRTIDGWQSHRNRKYPPKPVTWRILCHARGPHRIKILGMPDWCPIHEGLPTMCQSRQDRVAA